jgi:hypothetical protein
MWYLLNAAVVVRCYADGLGSWRVRVEEWWNGGWRLAVGGWRGRVVGEMATGPVGGVGW